MPTNLNLLSMRELSRKADRPISKVLKLVNAGLLQPDATTASGTFFDEKRLSNLTALLQSEAPATMLYANLEGTERTRFYNSHKKQLHIERDRAAGRIPENAQLVASKEEMGALKCEYEAKRTNQ